MRIKEIIFGVTSGWFVISLGALAYGMLVPKPEAGAAQPPRLPPKQAPAMASSVAHPPDFAPEVHGNASEDPELAALLYRYLPLPLSQHLEEAFVRDFFEDRKEGFLLDVGASHYKIRSNTHYLDIALGWHGIAIDAIPELGPDYAKYRPRTKFFPVFVSDKTDEDVDFFVIPSNSRLSTADVATAKAAGEHETRKLKTVTLNALLESQHVEKVDFLNMDIELWEPRALAGFDVDKYKPDLVVIEMHESVRQAVLDYFAKHNYAEIEKYSKWDGANAYFIPKDALPKFLARKKVGGFALAQNEAPAATPTASATAAHPGRRE